VRGRLRIACKLRACRLNAYSMHFEHWGFTAYAASETFALHHTGYIVAVWLFVTGVWVLFVNDLPTARQLLGEMKGHAQ
jgi:hypothetical protein